MASEENNGFLWFLVGASVGAAIALLYAPQSGKRTRAMLGRKVDEGREYFEDRGQDMADRGREIFDRSREMVDEAAEIFDRGRKMVESAVPRRSGAVATDAP